MKSLLAILLLLATTLAFADKPTPTYQKGTITGWEKGTDIRANAAAGTAMTRNKKVYSLKGADLIYKVDYCGAFEAGKFQTGQEVEYRVDGDRLYIRHDNDKEYKCKIEGTRALDDAKPSSK